MSTSNQRSPSVQITEHSTFALELTAYLNELRGDMSVRKLAAVAAAGGKSHWAQILAGAKVMTTNDIKVAADVFGMSPYEFVEQARRHAGHNVVQFPNVGAHAEDVEYSEYPDTMPAAAEEERKPGKD